MKNRILVIAATTLALALSGCAPGGGRSSGPRVGAEAPRRALPPIGQPGDIAAIEFGFARAAREEGQWTAFSRLAAVDAVIHLPTGPVAASTWLAGRADPATAMQWSPKTVWSGCDGTLAVSAGRYRDGNGTMGNYTTVWELQSGGEYRWTYDLRVADDPQPALSGPAAEYDEETIVVTRIPAIEGRVADCMERQATAPAPRLSVLEEGTQGGGAFSRDGTLRWDWSHAANGTRIVTVDYLRDGDWQAAHDLADPTDTLIVRPVAGLSTRADPDAVLAVERALATMAGERGQWTAYRHHAAPGALMFTPRPVDAHRYLAPLDNPPLGHIAWQPHDVFSSCDGSLAVTRGAWQRVDGATGGYTTVWQRQADGSYRWLMRQDDEPAQPLPAPATPRVTIAACDPLPPIAVATDRAGGSNYGFASVDGTLRVGARVDVWCGRIVTAALSRGMASEDDAPGTPRGFAQVLYAQVAPPTPPAGAAPLRQCAP